MFLTDEVRITRVANAASAGTAEVLSSVLDMAGWDGVLFIASLGDVLANSVLTLTAKSNSVSSTSGNDVATLGATTAWTATAADADNAQLVVDVQRPNQRYVFASLTRTAANAVVDGITAIQYRARSLMATQSAGVIASAKVLGGG